MRAQVRVVLALVVVATACDGGSMPPVTTEAEQPTSVTTSTAVTAAPPTSSTTGVAQVTTAAPTTTTVTMPPPIVPDPEFLLRYAAHGPVDMRANPFASPDTGTFPEVFAAHLYRVLPPAFTLIPELAAVPELAPTDEPPSGSRPIDGDGWVIRVPLIGGLAWSDGEPIDAHDVAFMFDALVRFGDPGEHGWEVEDARGTADLISVSALGDHRR